MPRNDREIQNYGREIVDFRREMTAKFTFLTCRGTAKFGTIYRDKQMPLERVLQILVWGSGGHLVLNRYTYLIYFLFIHYNLIDFILFIFMITWDQVMLVQRAAQFFVLVALKLFSID